MKWPFDIFDPSQRHIRLHNRLVAPMTMVKEADDIVIVRAEGTRYWDMTGKPYVDFCGGIGTAALGHGHPKIRETLAQQHKLLDFAEGGGFYYRCELTVGGKPYIISVASLAQSLIPLVFPDRRLTDYGIRMAMEVTGGTMVNATVKLFFKARPQRKELISWEYAFHGRHGFAQDLSNSNPVMKRDYPDPSIKVHRIPFPDSDVNMQMAIDRLTEVDFRYVNAFIGEYLLGEPGFRWPVVEYMDVILELIRQKGAFLAIDEIHTGLGRTGKWFAFQHGRIVPDVVICGKALGQCLPVSCAVYDRAIFDFKDDHILEPGWHGGTYPGYPMGVAVAIVGIDIIKEEKLVENAALMGEKLSRVLNDHTLASGEAKSCHRTGFGLMQGLEFRHPNGRPYPEWRDAVLGRLMKFEPVGIITLSAGINDINPVIRFEPCLTCNAEDLKILDQALTHVL